MVKPAIESVDVFAFLYNSLENVLKKYVPLPAVVGTTAVEHFFLKSAYSNGTYTSTTKPGCCV